MRTATRTLYELADSPPQTESEPHDGGCWVCAGECGGAGVLVERWQGANFTDQNKARHPAGTHVCAPCVWAMAWNVPPGFPPPPPGKKGLNLRLFSHLLDDRGYLALNKADKPRIRDWLRAEKHGAWFAAIADTGQKHVLPWTPVNPGGVPCGVVRFEERNVSLPTSSDGWRIVDAVTGMLTSSVTKDELARGAYSVRTYQQVPRAVIAEFERDHGRHRGGAWFDLVVWLSQRNEAEYEDRRQQGRRDTKRDGRGDTGAAGRVPRKRSQRAQALAATPGSREDGSADERKRARLDHDDGPQPATAGPDQLALFGDPGTE